MSEVGFGSPLQSCDESRSHRTWSAAFSFALQFLAARMGGREPCRFPQGLPGLPTRSSCRPLLEERTAVVANRNPWRPHGRFFSRWRQRRLLFRELSPHRSIQAFRMGSRVRAEPSTAAARRIPQRCARRGARHPHARPTAFLGRRPARSRLFRRKPCALLQRLPPRRAGTAHVGFAGTSRRSDRASMRRARQCAPP